MFVNNTKPFVAHLTVGYQKSGYQKSGKKLAASSAVVQEFKWEAADVDPRPKQELLDVISERCSYEAFIYETISS